MNSIFLGTKYRTRLTIIFSLATLALLIIALQVSGMVRVDGVNSLEIRQPIEAPIQLGPAAEPLVAQSSTTVHRGWNWMVGEIERYSDLAIQSLAIRASSEKGADLAHSDGITAAVDTISRGWKLKGIGGQAAIESGVEPSQRTAFNNPMNQVNPVSRVGDWQVGEIEGNGAARFQSRATKTTSKVAVNLASSESRGWNWQVGEIGSYGNGALQPLASSATPEDVINLVNSIGALDSVDALSRGWKLKGIGVEAPIGNAVETSQTTVFSLNLHRPNYFHASQDFAERQSDQWLLYKLELLLAK